ncbi:MAG: NUDIX hydrolase [Tenericutes bacterium]|nr:NUDIX hydrolase [Mycoplasmatota bacterium]
MYKDLIKSYKPINEQEQMDKLMMLQFIENNNDALYRTNLVAHFTSSAIIVNPEKTKVLFIHHNIYNSWGWVGGHNDGDPDFLKVSIKEAKEETGITNIEPYNDSIIGLDCIYVYNHIKKGAYVSDHLHMNLTYLLIASESEKLSIKEDENSGVKWFKLEEALEVIEEPRMKPIYTKYFNYVKSL